MKLPCRQFLHLAAGVAALAALSRIAMAQFYPSRPVRLVVATGAGGAPDIVARLMEQRDTKGLLRGYFPRGTDLSHFSQPHLNKIALRLNQRPRKTLGFETPADKLRAVLQ